MRRHARQHLYPCHAKNRCMTKFSVLLPTRNGGPFIDNCIRSILSEDADLELIVSDNANSDETPAVLDRWRADRRVKILRLNEPRPVSENWSNALGAARGEYLLMMGDDDCLLPGYFKRMESIIAQYDNPDCILYNAFSYVAPGSIGRDDNSYYAERHFRYEPGLDREMELPVAMRKAIVRDMFRFRVRIPLNMQTTLVRRSAGNLVPGGLFQPPFPDHFALNCLLMLAQKWVFLPEQLVVIGVSPKSFGHYVYSNQQASGLSYLGIKAQFPGRLEGNELLNGMHMWLNMLENVFPDELGDICVDRGGYVRRQAYAWLMQRKLGTIGTHQFLRAFKQLSPRDWRGLASSIFDGQSWERLARLLTFSAKSDIEKQWYGLRPIPEIRNIAEFARWAAKKISANPTCLH
ncbi:MAG: glycosyltransferase family 2 protein [Betaproteobacteria bacterium]|nr:glycosyltransferase family 2 protein [Betaproteobacteria bacterium]